MRQKYRYSIILLRELVRTDFKIRYQNSILGYVWSLLKPLLLFIILYLVFTKFLKVGDSVPYYPVYLLLGLLFWNFFVEVTVSSVQSIVGKGDLIRKINFPKYVILLATVCSALINFGLTSIVVVVFMIAEKVPVTWQALILIPLIIELILIAIVVGFFLSTAYVRFRDVSYIWDVSIQAIFYITPILYPLSRIPTFYAKIMILNPFAQVIQDARYVLITHSTETIGTLYKGKPWVWGVPIGITLVTLYLSAIYFRNRSKFFAEEA